MSKFKVSVPRGTEIEPGNSYLVISLKRSNGVRFEFAGVVPDELANAALGDVKEAFQNQASEADKAGGES